MPDIKIIQLKIRRGTNEQRKLVTLAEGEMGYCIDTKRTFIGDGTTLGGTPLTNKILITGTSPTTTPSEVGDITVYQSRLLQLTSADYTDLNNWSYIGPATDNTTVGLSLNGLDYKLGLIQTGIQLLSGLEYSNTLGLSGIKVKVDGSTIEINTSNTLNVKDSSISTAKIVDSAVTTDKIEDSAVKTAKIADSAVTIAKIDNASWGDSLSASGTVLNVLYDSQTLAQSANNGKYYTTLLDQSGIKLDSTNAAVTSFPFVGYTVNKWGIVTSNKNYLSGFSSTKPASAYIRTATNSTSAISAIAVDFTSLVSGLSGWIRIFSEP